MSLLTQPTTLRSMFGGLLVAMASPCVLVSGVMSSSVIAKAKSDRWIEVEVIMFTRSIADGSIREEFPLQAKPIRFRRQRDLLSKYHFPDIKSLFKAAGDCSVEQTLTVSSDSHIPSQFALSAEATAQLPAAQIDVAAFYNPAFIAPDLTVMAQSQPVDCNGQVIKHSWQDPYAFLRNLGYQQRSYNYHYQMFPRVIDAGEQRYNNRVHLVGPANFKLREIYRTLRRQPDIRPILHTSWREPMQPPSRAYASRLYGGLDYSQQYDFQGQAKPQPLTPSHIIAPVAVATTEQTVPSRASIVSNIERLLSLVDNGAKIDYQQQVIEAQHASQSVQAQPQQVVEVDGLMKLSVDKFNYLHIDAEFNVRREVDVESAIAGNNINSLLMAPAQAVENTPAKQLKNYHFKQTRRVITKQLHYFDHPYMGLIVQIRRHGW